MQHLEGNSKVFSSHNCILCTNTLFRKPIKEHQSNSKMFSNHKCILCTNITFRQPIMEEHIESGRFFFFFIQHFIYRIKLELHPLPGKQESATLQLSHVPIHKHDQIHYHNSQYADIKFK